jgi:pimeloyl-ACP methyl ester carboxylesterase
MPVNGLQVERTSKSYGRQLVATAALVAAFCGAASCSGASKPTPSSGALSAHQALTLVRRLPGSLWSQYHLATAKRNLDVYLVRDEHPKPIVVMLQGSGCVPLFTVDPDRTFHGTTIFEDLLLPRQSRFHFAVIEKQGVKPLEFTSGMTRQQELSLFKDVENGACSPAYFKEETEVIRAEDALDVVQALSAEPWVQQVFVVGHSEGSHVVAGVLRRDIRHRVTAAGLFSSAGPTQFYSGAETRDSFLKKFETMRMLQRADDGFMYEGHAARRWKSYALDTTPMEDVRDSVVPLYVAHGEREPNIHAADLFVLEALRQQPTRPLRYVVVEDGDHGFASSNGRNHFEQVFDDFLAWAINPRRATGVEDLR